ncbi:Insulin receptor binding [Tyrophagus putrescentiae]|nr:Insulin receptor binding [Tyrophagus putrescentiae]
MLPDTDQEVSSGRAVGTRMQAGTSHDVQIIETEASIGCGLRPSTLYELAVELSQIVLRHDNKLLFVWPLKHVRRYGYTSNSFSIEAGSKCITGEGLFIFRCNEAFQLYNQAIASVARIKQLKNNKQPALTHNSPKVVVPTSTVMPFAEELILGPMSGAPPDRAGLSLLTPIPKRNFCLESSSSQGIPHYVCNNSEYAEVMKRRMSSDHDVDSISSNTPSIPLLRINAPLDPEPCWMQRCTLNDK